MNRISILTIILVTAIASTAFCQVDTLQLVEIGSIQAPSEITELYVEDLDGDSLKEIILCTDSYVYIYNSQTYQVEWTSPPLNVPTDLLFEDINGDGLIDLSVQDSANIHLFDPHTPQTIWTSPPLDSTYKCYTIGDRNNDDWIDVAIVTKEWFTRYFIEDNRDTSWVEIFDGPAFNISNNHIILIPNYTIELELGHMANHREYPVNVKIEEITGAGGIEKRLLLDLKMQHYGTVHGGGSFDTYSGFIWIIDPENDSLTLSTQTGMNLFFDVYPTSDSLCLSSMALHRFYGDLYATEKIKIFKMTGDSLLSTTMIFDNYYDPWTSGDTWHGYVIGDLNYNTPGREIYYGINIQAFLKSYPDLVPIWNRAQGGYSIVNTYPQDNLFDYPHMIGSTDDFYLLFSGLTGLISAIFERIPGSIKIVDDSNGDNLNEIYILDDNVIGIYQLTDLTNIEYIDIFPSTPPPPSSTACRRRGGSE
jgi:hypothetical protein